MLQKLKMAFYNIYVYKIHIPHSEYNSITYKLKEPNAINRKALKMFNSNSRIVTALIAAVI